MGADMHMSCDLKRWGLAVFRNRHKPCGLLCLITMIHLIFSGIAVVLPLHSLKVCKNNADVCLFGCTPLLRELWSVFFAIRAARAASRVWSVLVMSCSIGYNTINGSRVAIISVQLLPLRQLIGVIGHLPAKRMVLLANLANLILSVQSKPVSRQSDPANTYAK